MGGAKQSRGRPKTVLPSSLISESPVVIPAASLPLSSKSASTVDTPAVSPTTDIEEGEFVAKSKGTENVKKSIKEDSKGEVLKSEKSEQEPRRLWVDVISDNRNPAKGRPMAYVAPTVINGEIEVEICEDDVASELIFWENALILYVLGEDMSMHAIKNFMQKTWNFIQLPDLFYHDEGYFILRFKNSDDMDAVLMKGPYSIRGKPVLIKEWNPEFNLKKDLLRIIPIWVKLPKLPLQLWGASSLNKIGSAIGSPLVTDECTTHKLRVSYARILVEVDITKKLPDEIFIKDNYGVRRKQEIEYEWRPKFCDRCQQMGHQCGEQLKAKVWKPRQQKQEEPNPVSEEAKTEQAEIHTTPSQMKKVNEADEPPWTKASRGGRDKGKSISFTEPLHKVDCMNGFDALGILTNHLAEIVILVETRVKKDKASAIRDKLKLKGEYMDNYAHHANGRIWIHWDSNKVDHKMVSSSSQYIHCGVYDKRGGLKFWLTAIYALNQLEYRKGLWLKMIELHRNFKGPWCAVGDYNNVATSHDRIGGNMIVETEYEDYNNMLGATDLCEMDSKGEFFTWSNKQSANPIFSRIDRLIANAAWFQNHSDLSLDVLSPHISDHAMLYLNQPNSPRQIRRNFRFNNSWTDIEGYQETVRNCWNKPMAGRPMERLWRKLQRLQHVLRKLSKPVSDIQGKIAAARNNLNQAYADLNANQRKGQYMDAIKKCTDDLVKWNDMEEKSMQQRTKLNWIKMGDDNSAYFHAYLKTRGNAKHIQFLQTVDGNMLTEQDQIEEEFLQLYKGLMGRAENSLTHIDIEAMRGGKQITSDQSNMLIGQVTIAEIEEALKGIGDQKSPVREFFTHGEILMDFNRTIVTLIPKHTEAKQARDYRPIAGCSTIYKIISKIMTKRLGQVLPSIIDVNQSAFIPGQVIHNHIMLAFELLRGYNRKGGTPRCMLQLDLQKAYDMVDWFAMEQILQEIGMPIIFINWIKVVVSTVTYEFNINGRVTQSMQARRGLRQGDPISPLLFVIMMEYSNKILVKMHRESDFKFHAKCKKIGLTNLTFADDILLFCRGDVASVQKMISIVKKFSDSTGLIINPRKCKVFCGGVDRDTQTMISRITEFDVGQLPMKYLGIPITSSRLNIHHYLPLIDKITQRMKHWTSKLLSYAGRILLIKSIILPITQYWMQCLPLPQFVIDKIDTMCKTFVWTGNTATSRKSPVAWTTMCKPKRQGGQGIVNLTLWNMITLLKCLWNLCCKADNMLVKWIHMVYLKGQEVMNAHIIQSCSWTIKRILELRNQIQNFQVLWDSMVAHKKFKMSAVYEVLTGRDQLVEWRGLFCRNAARPRAMFTTWLVCHSRLATRDRLKKFNMIRDSKCVFCQIEEESNAHLFFACKYTNTIWKHILDWIQVQHTPLPWVEELNWIKNVVGKKGWRASMLKLAFTETVYGIWSRRNNMVFGNITHTDTVKEIIDCIVYRGWIFGSPFDDEVDGEDNKVEIQAEDENNPKVMSGDLLLSNAYVQKENHTGKEKDIAPVL
ncbi:uncharacterized protein LOC131630409 [Vicia villosa]|uniref:uncharacterized protein LOC131630409 n=1 Tax=Vicia villosa TaxID=3911 RepID=UPI00273B2F7C|nr:uncharacterized protein LOC131630409 [Vicia villosa]